MAVVPMTSLPHWLRRVAVIAAQAAAITPRPGRHFSSTCPGSAYWPAERPMARSGPTW
jgi:hypothetical protein